MRNILRYRATQMMLILYYAEELKQRVVDCVRSTDAMRAALRVAGTIERVPRGVKQEHKKAIDALVDGGLLTPDERVEIIKLVNFRNTIAHELHNLTADLSNERVATDVLTYGSARPSHDYSAVNRIRYFLELLDRRIIQHGYVVTASFDWLLFHSAERTFLDDLKRLRRRIDSLMAQRQREVTELGTETSVEGTELVGDLHPRHPLNQYDGGRLTQRGVEVCYRLFDLGRSPLAVAHMMDLSLRAVRHRYKQWVAAGRKDRLRVDLCTLPKRTSCARYDD